MTTSAAEVPDMFGKMMGVEKRIEQYQVTGSEDMTLNTLKAFVCNRLSGMGIVNLFDDIIGCHSDEQLRQFASHLVSAVLLPMKSRAQPLTVIPSGRLGADAEVAEMASELAGFSIRNDEGLLKKECLSRDNNQCILTGSYDEDWAKENHTQDEHAALTTVHTECVHIIPFSLGNLTEGEIPGHAICWNALYRYFPTLRSVAGLEAKTINKPFNAITLAEYLRPSFDRLDLVFTPESGLNEYRIGLYQPATFVHKNLPSTRTLTLTSHDSRYALPMKTLFDVRAIVATISHAFGVGKHMDQVLKERESTLLAADGSTGI